MKTFSRDNRGGGKSFGKKFGDDRSPRKFGFGAPRGNGPAMLHDATCAECNSPCQVPFRPNGRKPVLCGNCFKKDEGGEQKSYSRPAFGERPSFGERRSFSKPYERPQASPVDLSRVEARLAAIEARLDELLSRSAE